MTQAAEKDRLGIQVAFASEALRGGRHSEDALIALVQARVRDDDEDRNARRVLRLRLVSACVQLKNASILMNAGQQSDTVQSMKITGRARADLRRMATKVLLGVAALLKGGKPDPIGVLKLALGTDRASAPDVLKEAFRGAMLRALVEKRVRKLGSRAWSIQLLSIVSSAMSTRQLLDLFSNLGSDPADGHVFEITRHDIEQARTRSHWPGMPISVIEHHRPGCRNPERLAVANAFIAQHRTQVKASKAACTTRLTPLVYVLTGNYLELFAKYLVRHSLFRPLHTSLISKRATDILSISVSARRGGRRISPRRQNTVEIQTILREPFLTAFFAC